MTLTIYPDTRHAGGGKVSVVWTRGGGGGGGGVGGAGGKAVAGVCLDPGNPLWTIEDPHLTLETLAPYVLTSHLRDSAVWRVPEGAAVSWVRMGDGNVDIEGYVRKYAALCPGRALSIESIVTPPRVFPFRDPKFWEPYRSTPAWEFERLLEIADRGKPRQSA